METLRGRSGVPLAPVDKLGLRLARALAGFALSQVIRQKVGAADLADCDRDEWLMGLGDVEVPVDGVRREPPHLVNAQAKAGGLKRKLCDRLSEVIVGVAVVAIVVSEERSRDSEKERAGVGRPGLVPFREARERAGEASFVIPWGDDEAPGLVIVA